MNRDNIYGIVAWVGVILYAMGMTAVLEYNDKMPEHPEGFACLILAVPIVISFILASIIFVVAHVWASCQRLNTW